MSHFLHILTFFIQSFTCMLPCHKHLVNLEPMPKVFLQYFLQLSTSLQTTSEVQNILERRKYFV